MLTPVPETWTVRRIVDWMSKDFQTKGIESARLDADLIVAHALGVDRVQLFLDLERPLSTSELKSVRALVARRREREPMAYILGEREFFGRRFLVDPRVLIPRPDTEVLVEIAAGAIARSESARVLDLCTGSGAIGLTLLAENENARVVLSDVSEDALQVAKANAKRLGLMDRAEFVCCDLFGGIEPAFDVVVANPPYVAAVEYETLAPDIVKFEPRLALVADDGGLAIVRRIIAGAGALLASGPDACVLIEIGEDQGSAVVDIGSKAGYVVTIQPDLAGRDRVATLRKSAG